MDKEKVLGSVLGCKSCGYYTCNTRDFLRHQSTKKHIEKISTLSSSSKMDEIDEKIIDSNDDNSIPNIPVPTKKNKTRHTPKKSQVSKHMTIL